MPKRHGWLTPNSGATDTLCRPVVVPLDDRLFYLAAVSGALNELTKEWNWEQDGDVTPAEAAEEMLALYEAYTSGDCTEGCICTIPPAFDIDIGITLKVIRLGATGYPEQLDGDEWVAPTGDYEIPEIPAREEPTADDRMCLAAKNAANVLEQIYEEATDAYAEFNTAAAVADAILGTIVTIMGLFGQATAASYISFSQTAFQTFTEYFGLLTSDVWTSDFTNTVACWLLDVASDDAGVVSFDFDALRQTILDQHGQAGLDFTRHILLFQLDYLLTMVMKPGLELAGTTTAITDDDCSTICSGPWRLVYDFRTGAHGWTIPWTAGGTRVDGSGIVGTNYSGSAWGSSCWISGLALTNDHNPTHIGGHSTKNASGATQLWLEDDDVVIWNTLNSALWDNTLWELILGNHTLDKIEHFMNAAANRGYIIHDIFIRGDGVFPPGAIPDV